MLNKCLASSTFEAVNSTFISRWQIHVRPLFQMKWRSRAFCRVSTRDSDILSSCDMNNEHAWTLQGNWDFFLTRASRGPFRLNHKTQGPSHIYIPKGKLLLRCLRKDGFSLQSKTENQLSSPDDMGCPDLSSCCFTEIDVPINLRWMSQGISELLKRMSSHLLYMMWNARLLSIQWRGYMLHLELIWGTPIYFAFLR